MGGGPDDPVASSPLDPAKLNDAPSQSPRPDENGGVANKSHENAEADDVGHETAAVVDMEIRTVKADCEDPRPDTEFLVRQLNTSPLTNEVLVTEAKGIYVGVVMCEGKCTQIVNIHKLSSSSRLDVTRYLLTIPEARLILLQDGNMEPADTIRSWFIKFQGDAIQEEKSSSLGSTHNSLPTSEEDRSHVCSPDYHLYGFRLALELRAKELEWPEYEEMVALTVAEIGEEGRQKVMDDKYFLDIGYELVDQFLQDLESAKAKAEKMSAEAEQQTVKAEQEAAQENADDDMDVTPTCAGETASSSEAQTSPSNDTQQAASKETSLEVARTALERVFEEIAQTAEVLDEAVITCRHSNQEANLQAQEPRAQEPRAFEEACIAPEESGKTADTEIGTAASHNAKNLRKKTVTERPPLVENRQLHDQSLYKKVGKEYWVLVQGQWTISRNSEQWHAMTELHRTLLCEYYDLLFVVHYSASAAVQKLAAKYDMPARMWKHAVQSLLDIMCPRIHECYEFMESYIIVGYCMMSLLDETIPQLRSTWLECKADLARYGWATEVDKNIKKRWRDTSKEGYTRVLTENPATGRIYHHLASLERPQTEGSPEEVFDATVSQLFYYTKSLIVKAPFYSTRQSVLSVTKRIVDRNEQAAKSAKIPQTDKDYFLTAVVHLILASLEPKERRKDHLQAVYIALDKMIAANVSTIRPSAKLGLLLCQLLLGIPPDDQRWSPMMMAWAPDFVTAEDDANSNGIAHTRDIHNAAIKVIHTMIPYLLQEADTRDLGVWEFIFVILVFMRSLKTRPDLLEWLGSAFHPRALAPFLNMLVREKRGGTAIESVSQSEIVTFCSRLDEGKRVGKYELSTEDSLNKYRREQEEKQKAESGKGTATVEEVAVGEVTADETTPTAKDDTATPGETALASKVTQTTANIPEESTGTTNDATTKESTTTEAAQERDRNTKTWERMYANVLPEHFLLRGLFFATEAEPCEADVQTADELAMEEGQEISLTDSETDSDGQDGRETEVTPLEEMRKDKVQRHEGLCRDPPLFPNSWFKNSKYNFEETQVHDYVQNAETCHDRSDQILRLAAQLDGHFFILETDENGYLEINVPGASSVPKLDPNKKMPEIIEHESGAKVVYVHPFEYSDIEEVLEKNGPAGVSSMITGDDDHEPVSAYDVELRKTAGTVKATTVAQKPSSIHDVEPAESAEVAAEPMHPVQGIDDSQDTKGDDAGPDITAASIPAEDPATVAQATELTEGVLDKMPGMENSTDAIKRWRDPNGLGVDEGDDGWTHVSDDIYEDAGLFSTVQTVQTDARSIFSRFVLG